MSEWSFVGAAYGLTWVVLLGYVVYLMRQSRGVGDSALPIGPGEDVG